MRVFRTEAPGEWASEFPTLYDATREPPSSRESTVATSAGPLGLVLAEAALDDTAAGSQHYEWAFTVAGGDVLRGSVRGMRIAS